MRAGAVVDVVIAGVEPLAGTGLLHVLGPALSVRVLADGLDEGELEREIARLRPRVIILGERIEHELLKRLKAGRPDAGIVVLANQPTALYGRLLLAAGAACVAYDAPPETLLAAVRATAAGRITFISSGGRRDEPSVRRELELLTPRELDVLRHLSRGRSAGEIALALGITAETVKTHTASVRRKLKVASRRDLIGIAIPADW